MRAIKIAIIGLTLALAGMSSGCAASHPDEILPDNSPSNDERVQNYYTLLKRMGKDPRAEEISTELDRAAVWLQRVEALLARPEEEREKLPLLLDAIEGQLVQMRAFLARRDAENALESKRSAYQGQMEQIEAFRSQNQDILDAAGGDQK